MSEGGAKVLNHYRHLTENIKYDIYYDSYFDYSSLTGKGVVMWKNR